MEIFYSSKEESNRAQEEAFLLLPPAERFFAFLDLSRRIMQFPVNTTDESRWKNNFIIELPARGAAVEGEY